MSRDVTFQEIDSPYVKRAQISNSSMEPAPADSYLGNENNGYCNTRLQSCDETNNANNLPENQLAELSTAILRYNCRMQPPGEWYKYQPAASTSHGIEPYHNFSSEASIISDEASQSYTEASLSANI